MGCGQWFEAEEGRLFELGRASLAGNIADSIRGGGKLKFRCDPCTARSRRRRVLFYGALALLILAGLVIQQLQS